MANHAKELIARVEKAGGRFVRITGKGLRRYRLGTATVDIPMKGLEAGRLRQNIEAEIRRAIKALPSTLDRPKKEPAPVPTATLEVNLEPTLEEAPPKPQEAESNRSGDTPHDEPAPESRGGGAEGESVSGKSVAVTPYLPSTLTDGYVCDVEGCGRSFTLPMHLGRHKQIRHGITTRVVREPILRTEPTDRPPAPSVAPTVTGGDMLAALVLRATEIAKLASDLSTEVRLIRDENDRLRAALEDLERGFQAVKAKPVTTWRR